VGFFRRKSETYNEQMLRDAGLDQIQVEQPTVLENLGIPLGRPQGGPPEWDATVTVSAPGLAGEKIAFTTLPEGDLVVSEEEGDADVSVLADAVEEHVKPPYRALAARQEEDVWSVVARQIEVAKIGFPGADELELSRRDSWSELRVDGEQSDTRIPELTRIGERVGPDFFVKAERLDGDLWEVRATAL